MALIDTIVDESKDKSLGGESQHFKKIKKYKYEPSRKRYLDQGRYEHGNTRKSDTSPSFSGRTRFFRLIVKHYFRTAYLSL